jgi:peptide/nickel transport system substrate-binding protein
MRCRLFVLFALFSAVLSSCSTPSASDSSTEAIVIGEGYEWEALNPLLGFGTEGASKLFDGLIRHDATLKVVPALAAEQPAVAADGRSWTVRLRQGVSFHDGSAFDADDVVATYRAVLNPVFASTIRSDYPMLTGVEKIDASTVRFKLAYPYAPFTNRLNLGIIPAEALATPAPLEGSPFNSAPIGTGPYKFVEWRKGATMSLAANEDYFEVRHQSRRSRSCSPRTTTPLRSRCGLATSTRPCSLPHWPAPSRAASSRWSTIAAPTTARSPCPRATR